MKLELDSKIRGQRSEVRSQKLFGRRVVGTSRLATCDLQPLSSSERAFTLLEVMIAMALFFMGIFAILNLTSQSLLAARRLQTSHVDVGGLAAMLSLTNRVEEGPRLPPGIVAQFEDLNPGYSCAGEITEVSSNGLFRVDFEIVGLKGKKVVGSTMSILLYRPESASSFRNKFRLNTQGPR